MGLMIDKFDKDLVSAIKPFNNITICGCPM
jgi:hypothetical protein